MFSQTFSKKERLLDPQIQKVFQTGKSFSGKQIRLLYLPCPLSVLNTNEYNQVAVIVSRKASKRAVYRNRSKRLMREVYRKNKNLFPTGYHLVFLQQKHFETISFQSIHNDFIFFAKKLKKFSH